MRKLSKKTLAVATTVVLLSGGGAAFAYWTTTGTGSGTAATGTSTAITVNPTSNISNLRPGGTAQTLAGNFTNAVANGPQFVASVTVAFAATAITQTPAGILAGTCTSADYVLSGSAPVGAEVATGTGGAWTGLTIAFANSTSNQDGCKGATVNLVYTANAS